MNFADKLIEKIKEKKSYLCVGLDPQLRYFPPHLLKYASLTMSPVSSSAQAIFHFNMAIINASVEFAACWKPQMAFYEKYGSDGLAAFELTVKHLKSLGEIVIEDAKREDGGDTADAYAEGHLGKIDVIGMNGELIQKDSVYDIDAITVTAWIDEPVLKPFADVAARNGKGIFVLAKTSFKPPSRFQEMVDEDGEKGWVKMAKAVRDLGTDLKGEYGYSPLGVVMGATYPEEADLMQQILPDAIKLKPGFGYQGGGADDAIIGVNDDGFGIIVNNSRGTNYAWHPKFKSEFQCDPRYFASASAKECEKARNALNEAVKRKIGGLPWE